MIKNTYQHCSDYVFSAYKDNAAVMAGTHASRFFPAPDTDKYQYHAEEIDILMKVETHNHPTAIAPYPGAATGSGGEIRDEGATGCGAKPKAGLVGFAVSNLRIPDLVQPWEVDYGKPDHIVSALDIMIEAPLGAAAFNNEFGRPALLGYFRTFEQKILTEQGEEIRGYHKPIMLAGGLGNIRRQHIDKGLIEPESHLIVLGGPAMNIGLGGGAASSITAGQSSNDLDFASVQRENPEMERRCQEVIDKCWQLGELNPISFIHDVGAGGLANAFPELVNDGGMGGSFHLRNVPSDEMGMSPLEIWCNESQERYVLSVAEKNLSRFTEICARERAPFAIIGQATSEPHLRVADEYFRNMPIDMPLELLLGKPPKMLRDVKRIKTQESNWQTSNINIEQAAQRVLQLPAVAEKTFLITIGDRSVSGMVCRDQMVGPWQIPVADVAVTFAAFESYAGEAMAMGERSPIALIDHAASARMAVGEAITNIVAADIGDLKRIKLSANWMAAAGHPGEDAGLFEAVEAIGKTFCPALDLTIPVGKDSMSMKTRWQQDGKEKSVTAPLSLVISAFAPVTDVRRTLTPQLKTEQGESCLLLIDLGQGKNRLGGSSLAQVYTRVGNLCADIEPQTLKHYFYAIQTLNSTGKLLAYHDRSDGGMFVTLVEMAFAGRQGVSIDLTGLGTDPLAALFNEELGGVIQIRKADKLAVMAVFDKYYLSSCVHEVGELNDQDRLIFSYQGAKLINETRRFYREKWASTTHAMQSMRDNSACADQELASKLADDDPGLHAELTFDVNQDIAAPYILKGVEPKLAILREQGVNSHVEMAAAFDRAGFTAIDLHMTDILSGRVSLQDFHGLVACGGFSYGDVLGAGEGWAKSILFNDRVSEQFATFFARDNTFSLGVCNGCQMMSNLKSLIPGADAWPHFVTNQSERFEARVAMVEIMHSPSVLFSDMQGSKIPIAVSHGEGRAESKQFNNLIADRQVTLRYVNNFGEVTEQYPANPNGSPKGITGVTSLDGRATIMMPHPERVFRAINHSWYDHNWEEDSPWMRMFRNARIFCG
jgi:phosphoribosylformylglycinamidine synthase